MRKTIVYFFLIATFVVLQSFQSCRDELVIVSVENNSQDTIYCSARLVDNDSRDEYWGLRFSYGEWKRALPGEKVNSFSQYLGDKESESWKVRVIKHDDMGKMPWDGPVDISVIDSLCSMIKTYTYEDLKSLDFCVRYY